MPYEPEWLPVPVGIPNDVLVDATHVRWLVLLRLGAFGQANIDATGPIPEWIRSPQVVAGLSQRAALTSTHLYWLSRAPSKGPYWISRSDLEEEATITGKWLELGIGPLSEQAPRSLASDGTYLYIGWGKHIGRLHIESKVYEPEWLKTLDAYKGGKALERGPMYALAVSGGYIYWGVPGGVARARDDGTLINENWARHTALSNSTSIAVGTDALWVGTSGSEAKIVRVPFATPQSIGRVPGLVFSTYSTTMHVAVDSTYLYWSWYSHFIARWNLDEIVTEPVPGPEGKEKEPPEEEEGESGKEKEEKEEKEGKEAEKEKEEKEEQEKEEKEKEEREIKEKEEREKKVEEEEKQHKEEEVEEVPGGGGIEPPPPPPAHAAPHAGVVRIGRKT